MRLKDFKKFGRDNKRFQVRQLNGEYQVYGDKLEHICMCTNQENADAVAYALEFLAGHQDDFVRRSEISNQQLGIYLRSLDENQ